VGFMATLFCLAEDENCGTADILGFAGLTLGGGATGAGIGGVVGATLPQWRLVFPMPMHGDRPPEKRTPPRSSGKSLSAPPLLGSMSLHMGHGDEAGRAARGGSGVRLRLSAELGSGIASCLELERFGVGPRESMHQLGAAVTKMRTYGRVRPYALASVGRYVWQRPDADASALGGGQDSFGGSVGAGLRVHAGGPLWLGAEGRWHTTFSRLSPLTSEGPAQRRRLWSLTTGTSLSW
jgi:hypothetical protein